MNTLLQNCPLCNSGQFNLYLQCKDYTVSQENFTIVTCKKCAFTFTNPRPQAEDLGQYYESKNYISHTNEGNNVLNSLYKIARIFTIREKSTLLEKWSSKGKLLDIGCGTGEFLHHNQQQGWKVEGVEVNKKAREQAESKLHIKLHSALQNVPSDSSFDAITLWHVLEHVEDLQETCRRIHDLLDPNGTLVVAVPNLESYDAKYYQQYWAAYDVPRHLYHFSKKSMEQLWLKYGMKVETVIPMKLDAFYVSMLSEKYKTGKTNLLKASWVASKSNFKGQSSINYSSLIYIIRK